MPEINDQIANQLLSQIKRKEKGRLKVYIGMSAGVGKSYRMLQEAHTMLKNGVNVKIGFIETHQRAETQALVAGLPEVPRREVFYKGKKLDELDVNAILILKPEWVIVDELAHSNIPGSKNEKRWQDIVDLLNEGINVITAVNIQHIESINEEVKKITNVEVQERVPDSFLRLADEVVNIDLTAEDLITRLKEGKIYQKDKIQQALGNFFLPEKILQLRELALREVATQVVRKVESEVAKPLQLKHMRIMACISSNHVTAKKIIRRTARLANFYQSKWYLLYIQTPSESMDKIPLNLQRHLINNFKLATELGAEIIQVQSKEFDNDFWSKWPFPFNVFSTQRMNIANIIVEKAKENDVTAVCIGKPHLNLWQIILRTNVFNQMLKEFSENEVDLIILS